jgi:hypothetical protein
VSRYEGNDISVGWAIASCFCVFCVIIVRSWCRFGIWFVCVVVSGVRVVELLRCAVLLLGERLKKSGPVFESDECWEYWCGSWWKVL